MRIGLVTDSPCDLPEYLVERYKIEVVPAIIVLNGKPYRDGIDITRPAFYMQLPDLRVSPTTAAPSIEDFSKSYRKLFSEGCEHVIGIFTAEKLTAIANIARKAADEFNGKVSVIESGSLSLGIGYQVLAAAEAIEKGFDLTSILAAVQSIRGRLRVYAALDTLEFLRRSGRVPQAVATLGGLLNIKPVVELHEGLVKPVGAVRTTHQATEKLASLLKELGTLERLSILHTNTERRAVEFLEKIRREQNRTLPEDIGIVNVTTVIGTHVGPNGLGIAAVRKNL